MTKNQIEYWKLRWQQYYDMLKIKVEQEKLAIEWARHRETSRANKANEAIKWSELSLAERKFQVQVVLDNQAAYREWIKLAQKGQEIEISQTKLNQEWTRISQEAEKLLMSKITVKSDLALKFEQWKNDNSRDWIKTMTSTASLAGKILGEKEVLAVAAEAASQIGNEKIDQFMKSMSEEYPEYAEALRASDIWKVPDLKPYDDNSIADANSRFRMKGVPKPSSEGDISEKVNDYLSKQHQVQGFTGTGDGVQTVKSPSDRLSMNERSSYTPSGTQIIKSRDMVSGPGVNV